jgi:hypothetical protein
MKSILNEAKHNNDFLQAILNNDMKKADLNNILPMTHIILSIVNPPFFFPMAYYNMIKKRALVLYFQVDLFVLKSIWSKTLDVGRVKHLSKYY